MMKLAIPLSLLLALAGCHRDAPAAEDRPARVEPATARPATPAEVLSPTPGPRRETPRYDLELAIAAAGLEVAHAGELTVALRTTRGFTLHPEFPLRVAVRAPTGVGIAKTFYERADAASSSPTEARFVIGATPTETGAANVEALVSFAVCEGTACEPREERLLLEVVLR